MISFQDKRYALDRLKKNQQSKFLDTLQQSMVENSALAVGNSHGKITIEDIAI